MNDVISFDSATFRRVLGHYPTGVCVVTAVEADGAPVGMVVGSFTSVSLDPPLVAFFPAKTSQSWPRLAAVGKFCVNVLVMPGLQSANISAKLLRELGGTSMIGPVLVGMEKSVQIATMASNASELLTLAVLAAGGIAL